MDDPSVDLETFRGCLADLAKVNAVTLARVPTLDFLGRLRRAGRLDLGRPVEILDVGSGYGDTLDGIAAWSKRGGAAVRLTGIDLNPWAAQIAQAAHPGMPRFITGDVFAHEGAADIVVSSLFTHHLDDDQIVRFLRWMEAHAAVGWFVNDLHRHAFAYYGFGLLARLISPSVAGWSVILSLLLAYLIKVAVGDSFAMAAIIAAYQQETADLEPDPAVTSKLEEVSDKFRELQQRAFAATGAPGGASPLPETSAEAPAAD